MILSDSQSPLSGKKEKQDGMLVDNIEKGGKSKEIDEKDIGIKLHNPSSDETFEMTFNKEVDLEMNEVPVVLYELHENSLLYMDREEWERALILLQKAQVLIEQMNLENYK